MTLDIVKLYISLLGQFFSLSDISIASARLAGQSPSQAGLGHAAAETGTSLPEFVPGDANSLITCDYAAKILSEIVESAAEIDALANSSSAGSSTTSVDLGQEAKKAMRDFVESCRWKFEEAICGTWLRGKAISRLLQCQSLRSYIRLFDRCQRILPAGRLGGQLCPDRHDNVPAKNRIIAKAQRHRCMASSRRVHRIRSGQGERTLLRARNSISLSVAHSPQCLQSLLKKSRSVFWIRCTISWTAWYTSRYRRKSHCLPSSLALTTELIGVTE